MKFKLIIDKTQEEEVIVTAHERSALTEQLERLVLKGTEKSKTEPPVPISRSQPPAFQQPLHIIPQLTSYTEDDIKILQPEEIECITILDGKTYAVDRKGEKYRLKQRLYELEEILPPCFIRINKSALANEKCLDRFTTSFSGAVDAVFKCGYREYVSRRCFSEIRRRYEDKK